MSLGLHIEVVRQIKKQNQTIPCLYLVDPSAPKMVETDASELRYGGTLKQIQNGRDCIVEFYYAHWNDCQKNYSIVEKEILSIIMCLTKIQGDFLNKNFLLRIDYKSTK